MQVIAALRTLRLTGPEIAEVLQRPLSTVSDASGRASQSISTSRNSDGPGCPGMPSLRRACAFYPRRYGIMPERLLTANGSPCRPTVHAIACRSTRHPSPTQGPTGPQTNGKAERFIHSIVGGWAYGALYRNRTDRTARP